MNLKNLKTLLISRGCNTLYAKKLAPNDNSKNQVYFGGSFEILNILPVKDIQNIEAGDWKRERFKAALNFSWITEEGEIIKAPNAQLILYPKYPEVRFSGFLSGARKAPSALMAQRLANRVLFISVDRYGNTLGFVSHPESNISKEYEKELISQAHGIFSIIELSETKNNKLVLLEELLRIHNQGWIDSKRLDKVGNLIPCKSSNCGGYTLEAELGILPNGYSEPDFLGWEIKQFGVRNFTKLSSSVITLMTPEPTDGIYQSQGVEFFIRKFGYPDKLGRPDRMNFGGIHKVGHTHDTTKLEMKLIGYDKKTGKIRNSGGRIVLVNNQDIEAASWSFSSMLLHWNRKHANACYIPSLSINEGQRKYKFSSRVILGMGTDFQLFLSQLSSGNIYYDPGIKLENMSGKPKIKRRSQFRIKSEFLCRLYKHCEIINLLAKIDKDS